MASTVEAMDFFAQQPTLAAKKNAARA